MSGRGPTLLFGGTFDPPHRGHVEPCRAAADAIGATRIIVIPAAISPTKAVRPTDDVHRLAMLELAFADEPRSVVSTIELDRAGPSYFVDTAEALREQLGAETDLRFLVGADHALGFRTWRAWERILEIVRPVVVVRPPLDRAALERDLARTWGDDADRWIDAIVEAPWLDIDATDVRARLDAGRDTADLLEARVLAYIERHALYRGR